jgi:hypothetical protein
LSSSPIAILGVVVVSRCAFAGCAE